MGEFLSPFHGVWARRASVFESGAKATAFTLQGLKGHVEIQVDTDQVKHIFADNDQDLYFAQGWVLASDRLWQMEFITRVASGRLSEVVGRKGLEVDKFFIKMGLPQAAKESADLLLQDGVTGPALRAYAEGVNAYIRSLKDADLPFEYKLLSFKPELWAPEKAALLLKFMAFNLAGFSLDIPLSRSRAKLNPSDFDDLFPLDLEVTDPIVPRGKTFSGSIEVPRKPTKDFAPSPPLVDNSVKPHPGNGSNNWAVMGKKSTTGLPILSNDVHLSLTLPSLWYEVQLVSPTQNVYGVTLPGAPGVVLGFNSSLAWAVTNGGTDILDWYQLRYHDDKKSEYLVDGKWRPVVSQEVKILVRDEEPVKLTLRQTHYGPIVYDGGEDAFNPLVPKDLAMRWEALQPSNELRTFLLLNRAKTTSECKSAILGYKSPDQNFLCADNKGDVGIWHMGEYPIRWAGQGRMISDGSSSEWNWKGWVPREEVPFVRNPDRGFLSSANQLPADSSYPYYLGWPFEKPYRAMRINELLRAKPKFSAQDLMSMQMDTLSIPARETAPALVKALKASTLSEDDKYALDLIQKWDFRFDEKSRAATVFNAWFNHLRDHMWKPYFPNTNEYMYPPLQKTIRIITTDPQSKWFDNPDTTEHESLKDVALASFKEALIEIRTTAGNDPASWAWGNYRQTSFAHLGKINGLGSSSMPLGGVAESIFANTGEHGPVWKLVVALGKTPHAWGVYPGGQSGDPLSPFYDNFLEPWQKGAMKELIFLPSKKAENPRLLKRLTLDPKGEP
jgi:penicillin amidase